MRHSYRSWSELHFLKVTEHPHFSLQMLGLFRGPLFPSFHNVGGLLREYSGRLLICSFSDFLCPQHHQIIQQYMVTLENLLFTAELDPHILAVFQQFCALQA